LSRRGDTNARFLFRDPSVEDDWSRAELEEHVRDEHPTFSWILEPMAVRCGFTVESAEYSDDQILAMYILRRT